MNTPEVPITPEKEEQMDEFVRRQAQQVAQQPPRGQSAVPADAIAEAIDILTQSADDLRECHTLSTVPDDWSGELEAKAEYDRILRCVAALRCQPAAATAAPSDDEIEALAIKHIAPHHGKLVQAPYQQTEQFKRIKALILELLARYGRQQAESADQVQALREALHAAAEYIGDRSAGSSTFWDLYDAAMAKDGGGA